MSGTREERGRDAAQTPGIPDEGQAVEHEVLEKEDSVGERGRVLRVHDHEGGHEAESKKGGCDSVVPRALGRVINADFSRNGQSILQVFPGPVSRLQTTEREVEKGGRL